MSLVHADNFNIYGSDINFMLDGVYATVGGIAGSPVQLVADPDGVSPGRVMYFNADFAPTCRYVLKNPTSKVGAGQRVFLSQLPNDSSGVAPTMWRDSGNNFVASYQITNTGSIKLFVRNAANTADVLVGDTITPVVTAAGWYHIEAAFEASTGAVGTFEVRVEGVTVLDITGIDTYTDTIYSISQTCQNGPSGDIVHFKDYVVWDTDGTQNNDFLGAVIVAELTPNSDVTAGGWLSTGANIFGVLDNNPPDNAQYISADDTPPAACEVGLTNLPADITSVKGVISIVRAGKVDGGDGQLQITVMSNGQPSAGADRPITAAQIYWADVHELNPDGDVPWTPGTVDAATLVIDRTV